MNGHFSKLIFLAVVVIAAAAVLLHKQNDVAPPPTGLLLEDLAANAQSVDKIEISNAQGLLIEAKLQQGQWRLVNDNDYPAEQSKLAELVNSLAIAKRLQAKTTKAEYYSRLGLQDIAIEDSMATEVTLLTNSGKNWRILVGKTPANGGGQYVRISNDKQSWLIDQTLSVPLSLNEWLIQPILPESLAAFQYVERAGSDGWSVFKADAQQENYQLSNMPEGRELSYATVLNGIVSTIRSLNFEEKQLFDPQQWQQLTPVAEFNLTDFDGKRIHMLVAKDDNASYVHFSSDDVSGYWQQWQYQISSFSSEQLSKTLEDFLQQPTVETDAEESIPSIPMDEGESPQ